MGEFIVLLFIEFYDVALDSAWILRAVELSPSRSESKFDEHGAGGPLPHNIDICLATTLIVVHISFPHSDHFAQARISKFVTMNTVCNKGFG